MNIINKIFKNTSGKTIQFPLRLSDGFCWHPNEKIKVLSERPDEHRDGTNVKGYIVFNMYYTGAHRAYETGWISETLLIENFTEIKG